MAKKEKFYGVICRKCGQVDNVKEDFIKKRNPILFCPQCLKGAAAIYGDGKDLKDSEITEPVSRKKRPFRGNFATDRGFGEDEILENGKRERE